MMDLAKLTTKQLLDRLERSHDYAIGAQRLAMQYPGFETGRKARERFDVHDGAFSELLEELRRRVC